jgi:mono/diheme cytochrome c family protein
MNARPLLALLVVLPLTASRLAGQASTPKDLYDKSCKKCHGVVGNPPKSMRERYPKIATFDSAFIAKHTEDSIVTILTKGKGEDMKSFKGKLSAPEMVIVAKYVHELGTRPRP